MSDFRDCRTGCNIPKISGDLLVSDCSPVVGGTPVIRAPRYRLSVTNASVWPPGCNFLTEDDALPADGLQDENDEYLCLDDV